MKHGENIYKRRDGRWEGRYRNGFKPNGKPRYSSVYGKTYTETRAKLTLKRIKPCDTKKCILTVGELFELWLVYIAGIVKESTYANYTMKIHKHILPVFGKIRYEFLTAKMLNDFIAQKISAGLSPKYVSDILTVFRSMCKFAQKTYGYADKSVNIERPKNPISKEKTILSESEQNCLYSYLKEHISVSNVGILLSACTGLRIGELCALKWSDIDFEKRTVAVSGTVQRITNLQEGRHTKVVLMPPKSRSSAREIPLPDFIMPILQKYRSSDGYILSGNERYIEPRTMQYRFKSILKKVKLPSVSFHSLRHAFATRCIALGFDVKTLSEILGHSSVEITLNRYVHSSMDRKRECMKLLKGF